MGYKFKLVRVEGRVKWHVHGSGDACASLILKRGNVKLKTNSFPAGELYLADYSRGSSPNGVTTTDFDFKPDTRNAIWRAGARGKVASNFHSTDNVCNYFHNFPLMLSPRHCPGESVLLYYYLESGCKLTFHSLDVRVTVKRRA